MKLRPVQFVFVALLLATLRLADPTALAPGDLALRAGVLNVLLRNELAEDWAQPPAKVLTEHFIPAPAAKAGREPQALSSTAVTLLEASWTMPPPARQSADLQSFTSFLRA